MPRSFAQVNGARTHVDAEVEDIVRTLRGYGVLTRERLAEMSHAGRWRESTFDLALASAVDAGRVRRLSDELYELSEADPPRTGPSG